MNPIRIKLAEELRATLARQEKSGAWLAKMTGISSTAMNNKLKGRVSFTLEEIIDISSVIGTTAADLVQKVEGSR